ncbi:hypothetical protein [Mesorhizobium sp. M0435]|uniref:hypothetical protein n=1 Tax=Mesorhizobium sp. M0435 TaxID=2956944 RepID=UPI00333A1ECD
MSEKILASVVSLAISIIYFTGFCYLYFYYLVFGVTPLELDLNIQYVFVHAFPVIWYFIIHYTTGFFFGLLASGFACYWFRRSLGHFSEKSPIAFLSIFLTIALVISYNAAIYSGRKNAETSLTKLHPLFITFKNRSSEAGMAEETFRGLRHITTTKETVFALKFSGNGDEFWTIRIPADSVGLSNVYMD